MNKIKLEIFSLIYYYITILILVQNTKLIESNLAQIECLIQNNQFKYEYLYTCDDLDEHQYYRRHIYTNTIINLNNLDEIKWTLIPVLIDKYTYYLKSNKYNEYLCVSKRLQYHRSNCYVNSNKRMAHTFKYNSNLTSLKDKHQCQWRLENVDFNKYKIWNVLYNQMLFAESDCFKSKRLNRAKRSVYLTHKPNSKSYWMIDCFNFNGDIS
jgi:hypothetical protein